MSNKNEYSNIINFFSLILQNLFNTKDIIFNIDNYIKNGDVSDASILIDGFILLIPNGESLNNDLFLTFADGSDDIIDKKYPKITSTSDFLKEQAKKLESIGLKITIDEFYL